MKAVILFFTMLMFVSLTQGQDIIYPTYSPFGNDLMYDEDNPYPYFYASETSPSGSFFKGAFQYAYGQGRSAGDGNSSMNVYFSTDNLEDYPNGKPLVVILHGRGGTKEIIRQKGLGEAFAKRGYFVIEPDYTTEADPCFAGNPCKPTDQWKWVLRYAVSDVRAAIRKVLKESSEKPFVPEVDESSIFIVGFSFGAITAAHLAYADESDYSSAEYDVASITCGLPTDDPSLYDSLDYLSICEDSSQPCPNDFSSETFELRDGIKGISLVAPMILDLDFIDSQDRAQALMFHGTCDEVVAIDEPRLDELWYRRKCRNNIEPDPDEFFCNSAVAETKFYGSIPIFQRMQQVSLSTQGFNLLPGFFLVCGGGHGLSGDYFNFDAAGNINGIGTYETIRFFATLMNNDHNKRFLFNLDHKSLPGLTQANIDELEPKCAAMPLGGFGDDSEKGGEWVFQYLENNLCPDCSNGSQAFSGSIFEPAYLIDADDADRYLELVEDEACATDSVEAFTTAQLFTLYGDFISQISLNAPSGLPNLQTQPNLTPGMYVLRYPDGKRRTIVIYE